MMADEVQSLIDIQGRATGVDAATVSVKGLSGAMDGVVAVSDKTEKVTLSVERAYESLQRRYDSTYKAQQQQSREQGNLDKARAQGLVNDGRYAFLQGQIAQAYKASVDAAGGANKSANELGESHARLTTQGMALAHAMRTGTEELALGIPVTQVLAQQFSHLSYAASGEGGLAGAFGEIKGLAGGAVTAVAAFVTPALAATSAVGLLAVGAVAVAAHWQSAQHDVEMALQGIGRQSGVTASDINAMAASTARSSELSIGQSRALATAYAATGQIAKENIGTATQATEGLAKALGVDATEASKLLAGALSDPAKGVGELAAKVGGFNVQTREMIDQALRNGNVQQAQALMINGVVVATQGAIEANKGWSDSFSFLWKSIKDGADLLGGDIVKGLGGGKSREQQLAGAQAQQSALQAIGPQNFDPQSAQAYADALAKVAAQIAKLKQEIAAADLASWNAQLDRAAAASDNATRALVPQIDQIRNLEAAVSSLTRAQNVPSAAGVFANDNGAALTAAQNQLKILQESKAEAERYNQNVKAIASAYGDVSTKAALSLVSLNNQLLVATAIGGQAKIQAQEQATINDLLLQGKTLEDAIAIAAAQRARVGSHRDHRGRRPGAGAQRFHRHDPRPAERHRGRHRGRDRLQNAMAAGADSAAAAALSAATLANYTARAAASADQAAAAAQRQAIADANAQVVPAGPTQGTFTPDTMPTGQHSFVADPNLNVSYRGGASGMRLSIADGSTLGQPQSMTDLVNRAYAAGGVDAAIAAVTARGMSAKDATESSVMSTIGQLYDLKNSSTTDKSVQRSNLLSELSTLETLPATIARDQTIAQLVQNINSLTDAINQQTDATNNSTAAMHELPGYLSSLYAGAGQVKGFGFASGGIMTSFGPLPLRAYAGGGIVNTPQLFAAGENYQPEAIIPLRGGAVPVQLSGGGSNDNRPSQIFNINAPITVVSNSDDGISQAAAQAAQDFHAMLTGFTNR
jgi:hypothetical protein